MATVIAPCTNRKRQAIPDALRAGCLPVGSLDVVAAEWAARLEDAGERYLPADLYGGRGFQEAVAASQGAGADLVILSAGLGLVDADTPIPAYGCTVLTGAPDSVLDRTAPRATSQQWWRVLAKVSRFSRSLATLVARSTGPILCGLPDAYLAMLSDDIRVLDPQSRARFRIFTRAPLSAIDPDLRALVMRYDDRLDGPGSSLRGTRSDFAQRALRHFVDHVLPADPDGSADDHGRAVDAALKGWPFPSIPPRSRHDDEVLRGLLREHWDSANGRSSALLRIFRDDLHIACEQGRFAKLVREMRGEMV